jgi:hypothetical protein
MDETETVTHLDEVKVLGYFETLRSTFLLKILLVSSHLDFEAKVLLPETFKAEQVTIYKGMFENDTFAALYARSENLPLNLMEDVVTSALIGSWIIFELIIKDRTHRDYSLHSGELQISYQQNIFGLSQSEKRDLDLFCYLRNAYVHYNGSYYGSKQIDHVFAGTRFCSSGHEGEKIIVSPETTWKALLRIEELALKAWTSWQLRAGKP